MAVKHKFSRKRQAIYNALKTTYDHPSAEMLYRYLKPDVPDLSLATVYRNLATMVQEGDAVSIGTVNGQERFDGEVSPHPHAICRCCGSVQNLAPVPVGGYQCGSDFEIEAVSITCFGLCAECRSGGIARTAQKKEKQADE